MQAKMPEERLSKPGLIPRPSSMITGHRLRIIFKTIEKWPFDCMIGGVTGLLRMAESS